MIYRTLGNTGIEVSLLALGTVKFGRVDGLKYPTAFDRPDDAALTILFKRALDLGITVFDTAPAYGDSEERLGRLLATTSTPLVVATKVGEEFEGGVSRHDFSATHTRMSVERSLRRLRRDQLDLVSIHSDGNDVANLEQQEVLQTLIELKRAGLIRAIGLSGKTAEGIVAAVRSSVDVVMATVYPGYDAELPAIATAHAAGLGVLIKKAMHSGHASPAALLDVAKIPGVSCIVTGTINPEHLAANAEMIAPYEVRSPDCDLR